MVCCTQKCLIQQSVKLCSMMSWTWAKYVMKYIYQYLKLYAWCLFGKKYNIFFIALSDICNQMWTTKMKPASLHHPRSRDAFWCHGWGSRICHLQRVPLHSVLRILICCYLIQIPRTYVFTDQDVHLMDSNAAHAMGGRSSRSSVPTNTGTVTQVKQLLN